MVMTPHCRCNSGIVKENLLCAPHTVTESPGRSYCGTVKGIHPGEATVTAVRYCVPKRERKVKACERRRGKTKRKQRVCLVLVDSSNVSFGSGCVCRQFW